MRKNLTPRWKARQYQKHCVSEGIKKKKLALFLDPGLGKTSILLQIFNKLKIRQQVKAVLVVAPLNPCYMTWPEEIKGWTNFRRFKYTILHGPNKLINLKKRADIYIINPESLLWLVKTLRKTPPSKWPFDMLIVDESGKFGSHSSNQTKLMHVLSAAFKYKYIANGTPTANGFMRLMPQIKIIDGGKALGSNITDYRYLYFEQYGNPQWRQYRLLPGAEKRIIKKIAPISIHLNANDYTDMPKQIAVHKLVHLPSKVLKAYAEIENELYTLIQNHELVAESSASKVNKLHQFCNGIVYEDQDPLGKPLPSAKRKLITLHDEKLKALDDLIEEFNGKPILIGYKFQHDKVALQKYYGKRITFFDSATTEKQKVKLQKDWNDNKIPLLAGNPQSVGHGLNLQKGGAHVIAFYSVDHDYETHDQFIRRLMRSGNTSKVLYTCYILAKGLYDHDVVYPNLESKGSSQDSFLRKLAKHIRARKKLDKN